MSTHDQLGTTPRDGWFVRTAAFVGDLGNPFYAEERQRDVWNEASAVGFQLVLWLGLATATAMVWLGGEQALPYAVTLLGVVGLPSIVSIAYAERLGVRVDQPSRVLRLRLVPYGVMLGLFGLGAAQAAPDGGFVGGMGQGAALGGALGVAWLLVDGLRQRRRARG